MSNCRITEWQQITLCSCVYRIPDPEASKPDDWDEDAPREVVDEDAEKPEGWLDDEPEEIDDPGESAKLAAAWFSVHKAMHVTVQIQLCALTLSAIQSSTQQQPDMHDVLLCRGCSVLVSMS